MTAFEDFVNTEVPKRVGLNNVPGGGNMASGVAVRTTGVGLGVVEASGIILRNYSINLTGVPESILSSRKSIAIGFTSTDGNSNTIGLESQVTWNPSTPTTTGSMHGINFAAWKQGSNQVQDVNGISGFVGLYLASGVVREVNAVNAGIWNYNSPCDITTVRGFYNKVYSPSGDKSTVNTAYDMHLTDLELGFNITGVYYGIKQEGANARNEFAGEVSICKDDTKLYFGDNDDASINFNGTDLVLNTSEVGTGSVLIGSNDDVGLRFYPASDDGKISWNFSSSKINIGLHNIFTYTGTSNGAFGNRVIVKINPSGNNSSSHFSYWGQTQILGSNNIGPTSSADYIVSMVNNSNTIDSLMGVRSLVATVNSTSIITNDITGIDVDATLIVGSKITVNGNAYQCRLHDYENLLNISGAYYGIKQEGTNALNEFAGDVEVSTSGNGLILFDTGFGTRHRVVLTSGTLTVSAAL